MRLLSLLSSVIRKVSLAEPQYQWVDFNEIFFEFLSEELRKAFRELVR